MAFRPSIRLIGLPWPGAAIVLTACASGERSQAAPHQDAAFPDIGYATWTDYEPPYRLYPGDQIECHRPHRRRS
ncbi:MAG: hypothetical protein WDM92_16145 [Caulobacteraceae bacterium]